MVEKYNFTCSKCGKSSTVAETSEQARAVAIEEGFQFRPGVGTKERVLCDDCGTVKQMNTTSSDYYKRKDIKRF